MPLAEAKALGQRQSQRDSYHLLPHDAAQDRAALLVLAQWCCRFSPLVGLEEGKEPSALLLDLTGLEHLFGGEPTLAKNMCKQLQQQGYVPRLAIADTVGAAWALAHYATDGQSPTISSRGKNHDVLALLPIESLRLAHDTSRRYWHNWESCVSANCWHCREPI